MQNPWSIIGALAASGSAWASGSIPLIRARTLSITAKASFGASIDADTTVYLYYSPDGKNWDTIEYTSFALTYDADDTVQRTAVIDVPEHGFIMVKLTNGSSNDTVTNCHLWYSIQSWGKTGDIGRGAAYIDTGEEKQIVEKEAGKYGR